VTRILSEHWTRSRRTQGAQRFERTIGHHVGVPALEQFRHGLRRRHAGVTLRLGHRHAFEQRR
jgi:hypothetical protein